MAEDNKGRVAAINTQVRSLLGRSTEEVFRVGEPKEGITLAIKHHKAANRRRHEVMRAGFTSTNATYLVLRKVEDSHKTEHFFRLDREYGKSPVLWSAGTSAYKVASNDEIGLLSDAIGRINTTSRLNENSSQIRTEQQTNHNIMEKVKSYCKQVFEAADGNIYVNADLETGNFIIGAKNISFAKTSDNIVLLRIRSSSVDGILTEIFSITDNTHVALRYNYNFDNGKTKVASPAVDATAEQTAYLLGLLQTVDIRKIQEDAKIRKFLLSSVDKLLPKNTDNKTEFEKMYHLKDSTVTIYRNDLYVSPKIAIAIETDLAGRNENSESGLRWQTYVSEQGSSLMVLVEKESDSSDENVPNVANEEQRNYLTKLLEELMSQSAAEK